MVPCTETCVITLCSRVAGTSQTESLVIGSLQKNHGVDDKMEVLLVLIYMYLGLVLFFK